MLTRHHHLLGTQGHTQHKEDRTITSWQFPRSEGLKPLLSWVSNTTANQATGVTAVEEGVLRQETQEHHYMFLETKSLLTGSSLPTPVSSLSPLRSHLGDPDPAENLLRSLFGTRLHGEYMPHLKAGAQTGHCGHGTVTSRSVGDTTPREQELRTGLGEDMEPQALVAPTTWVPWAQACFECQCLEE